MGMDKKLNKAFTVGFNEGFITCREVTKKTFKGIKGIGPKRQEQLMQEFEKQLREKWVELNGQTSN